MSALQDFSVKDIHGHSVPLSNYLGQVLLVVNVASRCGFTNQYAGLESLQRQFSQQGFSVLGFPCNQFGSQEPGQNNEILDFCEKTFNVTFPLFSKIDVNGNQADPFYTWLKKSAPGLLGTEAIKWNFTKFLIARDGSVIRRYAPNAAPSSLQVDIVRALEQPVGTSKPSIAS